MVICVVCGLPIVSGAAYTLWVATQGIYRRYIVIVFVINTGKYRNVYRDKYGKPKGDRTLSKITSCELGCEQLVTVEVTPSPQARHHADNAL